MPPFLLSLLTVGLGPIVNLALGKIGPGRKTINAVRAVQGFSIWSVLFAVASNTDFWVAVLPGVMRFIETYFSETLVGAGVAMVLSIVFEGLRRVTAGPVR